MYSYLNSLEVYWNTFQWSLYGNSPLHFNIFGRPKGIYIIWYQNYWGNPVTVRVGQGDIKARLSEHRLDPAIRKHAYNGLYVSWTPILFAYQRNGVERYLGNTLNPLVGSNYPVATPKQVNLPWNS